MCFSVVGLFRSSEYRKKTLPYISLLTTPTQCAPLTKHGMAMACSPVRFGRVVDRPFELWVFEK